MVENGDGGVWDRARRCWLRGEGRGEERQRKEKEGPWPPIYNREIVGSRGRGINCAPLPVVTAAKKAETVPHDGHTKGNGRLLRN